MFSRRLKGGTEMKSHLIRLAVVSLFTLLLLVSSAACASSQVAAGKQPAAAQILAPTSPATQALALGSKQAGNLTVSLFSNPNPPIRGNNAFEAFVTDAQGQPVSDAKLSFDIDMTNMSHGKNVVTASPLGEGHYSATINLFMPGPWRVIVIVERAGQTETARFDFNVNWK